MSADNNIYLTVSQILQEFLGLLSRTGTCQIIHSYGQVFQSAFECLIMLICQYRSRNQNCHLFRVACSLECRTYCHFRLSEADIATHQTVHRTSLFHIRLDIVSHFQLVRGILIQEGSFQFVLHKRIGTKRKTLFPLSGGIQFNEVARNVFKFVLGTFFQSFPLSGAQLGKTRRFAIILCFIFTDFIERMDRHINRAATLINDLDHLLVVLSFGRRLLTARYRHAHKTTEFTNTMVHMHHIVAYLKLLYLFQCQGSLSTARLIRAKTILMETIENLVVSKHTHPLVMVNISSMNGFLYVAYRHLLLRLRLQDILKSLQLFGTVCKHINAVALILIVKERFLQQIKILMKQRLWRRMESLSHIGLQ